METKITTDERILLNEPYVQTEKEFIKHCQSRGLRINEVHLRMYQERGYLNPAYNIDGYEYYDPFQIFMPWQIEKKRLYLLESPQEFKHEGKVITTQIMDWLTYVDSDFNKKQLSDTTQRFEPLLELLLKVRYYYQPEIDHVLLNRTIHTGFPEVIGATKLYAQVKKIKEKEKKSPDYLRLLKLKGKTWEDWEKERKLFDAKAALEDSYLEEKEVFDWAVDFQIEGSRIDPFKGSHEWRVFLDRIRGTNRQRLEKISGPLALARDFYLLTDLLTNFLQDALKKTYTIHPFDMTDGKIGQWRKKKCERCKHAFEISDWHERFCQSCKEEIVWNKEFPAGVKCEKCGNVLQRLFDGQNLFNNFTGHKPVRNAKTGKNERQVTVDVTLAYGSYVLTITCPCGHVNQLRKEVGWFK